MNDAEKQLRDDEDRLQKVPPDSEGQAGGDRGERWQVLKPGNGT